MPSGRTHALVTLIECAAVPAALYSLGYSAQEIVPCAAGLLISLAINPDLDVDRRFPRSRPSEWPWWIYWYPYSRLIYHRSVLSHLPVLSTLIRLLYIYPLLLFGLWLLGITLAELPPATGWIFLGLALSDTVHTLLDKATTRLRRAF